MIEQSPKRRRLHRDTMPPPLEEWTVIEERDMVSSEEALDRHPFVVALAGLMGFSPIADQRRSA